MGATTIMIIRHAEKPGTYDGIDYRGVNPSGAEDKESLVTLGWERAGALATLFSPPWGPGGTRLSVPGSVFAADPADKSKPDAKGHKADDEPSQRPYQTVSAVAAKLGLRIDTRFAKDKFKAMVGAALGYDGAVLISWQHQDIPHLARHILKHTGTPGNWFPVPDTWPGDRYDLVWVFSRPAGLGPMTAVHQVPQMLLAGDKDTVIPPPSG